MKKSKPLKKGIREDRKPREMGQEAGMLARYRRWEVWTLLSLPLVHILHRFPGTKDPAWIVSLGLANSTCTIVYILIRPSGLLIRPLSLSLSLSFLFLAGHTNVDLPLIFWACHLPTFLLRGEENVTKPVQLI